MRYDFDSVVSREGWGASKWEAMRTTDGLHPLGIVPFSIADMEFRVAPEIQETLKKTVEMGVLGYTEPTEEYYDAVMRWMERRHNWRIEQEWIQPTYGVVVALLVAVRALTKPGDGVIIQPPVYRPFRLAIEDNGRRTVENPLKFSSGRYEMDYEDLERKARDPNVTMAILCSPHNPVAGSGPGRSSGGLRRYAGATTCLWCRMRYTTIWFSPPMSTPPLRRSPRRTPSTPLCAPLPARPLTWRA